jgi:acyl dehydratase
VTTTSVRDLRDFEMYTLTPSTEDLLRWASAAEDFSPIHFDAEVAHRRGFEGPLVHGPWKSAVLRRLLSGWLGTGVRIESFTTRYLRPDVVGRPLHFGGRLVDASPRPDGTEEWHCVLWVRDDEHRVTVEGECTAEFAPAVEDSLPLERVRAAVKLGHDAGSFVYRVESNDVAEFAKAIGAQSDATPGTAAPATFFAALDPVERRDLELDGFLQRLPFQMTGGGNAFNEVEYQRPIRVGDVITVTTRYTEVYEKTGSRGTLLFRVRTNEMRDAEGELVATSRCGHVLSYRVPGAGEVK